MKDIRLARGLNGKRVLVRIDIDDSGASSYPIRVLLPTIHFLQGEGARIICLAHVGRDTQASAAPLQKVLGQQVPVRFVPDLVGETAREAIAALQNGDVALLENVRRDPREIAKDDTFAQELASLADFYVNEAFAVSHREHASVVGVPKHLPSFAGIQFQHEVTHLSGARNPSHPALCILGGAKFETKLPLIRAFVDIYDRVFVGGALANNFFKAKGLETGHSLVDQDGDITNVLDLGSMFLPTDVTVASEKGTVLTKRVGEIAQSERMVDVGPETLVTLQKEIAAAQYILWNGPLGEYENGFDEGTKTLAHAIAESNALSVVGGGDTLASIAALDIEKDFTFISTGGGAMLEFLLKGTLAGIEALR